MLRFRRTPAPSSTGCGSMIDCTCLVPVGFIFVVSSARAWSSPARSRMRSASDGAPLPQDSRAWSGKFPGGRTLPVRRYSPVHAADIFIDKSSIWSIYKRRIVTFALLHRLSTHFRSRRRSMERYGHLRARPGPNAALYLAISLLVAAPVFAQSSLKSRRDIATGNHPVGAIAVDFDGDGLLDVVSVDQMDDSLGLVKGFGDGTFRRVRMLAVGSLPSAVAFADTNGDGLPDLVTANIRSQEVTVNLNDGHGGYGAKIGSQVLGTTMSGMTVGDWNGDGRIDVAVIAGSLNTLVVMTGDGAGHFGTPLQYTVGTVPKQVVTADFNRDGKADLAIVNNSSASIQIWRGDGTGQFTLTTTLATGTGTSPQGLTTGDLDNDSDADLVVCNYGTDTVGVYLNNGSGGFGSPSLLSPGFGPRAAVIADVNKDGKPDLFVTLSKVSGVGQAAMLLGNGSGGFGAPSLVNTGPVPNTA